MTRPPSLGSNPLDGIFEEIVADVDRTIEELHCAGRALDAFLGFPLEIRGQRAYTEAALRDVMCEIAFNRAGLTWSDRHRRTLEALPVSP